MTISTLSLVESMTLHDRPAGWWGLDTSNPLDDDSGNGYTLTALASPANAASLHTRGDTGASGCRNFNGTTDGYFTLGTVYDTPEGPPPFHERTYAETTSATGIVVSPGRIVEGDLMLFVAVHATAAATVTTAPAGFTIVNTLLNAGTHALVVYKKTAVTADIVPQEYKIVWNSSAQLITALFVYRGLDTSVSGLIFDSNRQVTVNETFHATTTETHPAGARQLVIWSKKSAGTLHVDPGGAVDRLNTGNAPLQLYVTDYQPASSGSGSKTATTTVATTLGAFLITFGAPPRVTSNALDTISQKLTVGCLLNLDTVSGTDTIIRKHQSWGVHLAAGVVTFLYRDGGGTDRTVAGPTLPTGATRRLWIRDDGTNIAFFVNGTKTTAARVGAAGYTQNANRVSIAHYFDGGATSNFLDARVDELAVFAGPLTDQMIQAHETAATQGTFGQFLQSDQSGRFPRGKLELAINSNPTDVCLAYADVTADVRSSEGVQTQRGRNFELDRIQAGTASFVLSNRLGTYDAVKPTRVVRFRAQVVTDGVVYPIFFGYTDAPKFRRPAYGKDATVYFQATDIFKALALDKIKATLVRPTEFAGPRIAAVLNGIPGLQHSLETGLHLIVGDELLDVNRLEHVQAVAETDGGIIFADALGQMIFHDNQHRSKFEGTVRVIYSEKPLLDGGFALKAGLEPEVDESRLYTAAAITPASGNVQRSSNEAAALEYFERTKDVTTLHASDADALAMAHHVAQAYSAPLVRILSLRVQPAGMDSLASAQALWALVLAHEISHRIKTIERPIGTGSAVPREHFIEGVSHTVTGSDWQVGIAVSPTDLEGKYFKIGTSRIGHADAVIGW